MKLEVSQLLNKWIQTKGDSAVMQLVYSGIQLRLHLLLGYSSPFLHWEGVCWELYPAGAMKGPQGDDQGDNRAVAQEGEVFLCGGLDSV